MDAVNFDESAIALMIVVAGGFALAAALVLYALFGTGAEERQFARRLDAVQGRRATPAARAAKTLSLRRDLSDSSIPQLDSFVKRWLPQRERLKERIDNTGLSFSVVHYLLASGAVAIVAAAFAALWFRLSVALALPIGIAAGVLLPHLVLSALAASRRKAFIAVFPEAIDLIVRGLRSGLPITESVGTVAREIGEPVAGEFQRIAQSVQFGRTIDDAMWEANRRIDTPEFKFFVISLSLQRETGGNLAETLEKLSDILRRRRQMRQKIKAMSSEARASALIIGALPFIMCGILFLVSPEYIMTLFLERRGWLMIGAGFLSLSMGAFVMAKMVRFEI